MNKLTVFLIVILVLTLLNNISFGQEIAWERLYSAVVNGKLMLNAYGGGQRSSWTKTTFADINNDGKLEMFIGDGTGHIKYYQNDGTLIYPIWTLKSMFYGEIKRGNSPTFCDIDNDGDLDLFIGWGLQGGDGGSIIFYRNIGTKEEAKWLWVTDSYANIDTWDQSVPFFADIDSDGDKDLFIGSGYGNIFYCQNIGTAEEAVWDAPISLYDVGWKSVPALTDIDNDGDLDLFSGNDGGKLYFFRNDGTPQNAIWTLVTKDFAGISSTPMSNNAPVFADVDGDGDYDLIVSEYYGKIYFYRNDGDRTNPDFTYITSDYCANNINNGGIYSTVAFADIDNDGDYDLFLGKSQGWISFYRNVGNKYSPEWKLETRGYDSIRVSSGGSSLTFGDLDHDGDLDLMVGSSKGPVAFYRNEGDITNADFVLVSSSYISASGNSSPFLSDINGDNDLELIVGSYVGRFTQYSNLNSPDNILSTMVVDSEGDNIDIGFGSVPYLIDIDGDGDHDMFSGSYYGNIIFLRNDGDKYNPKWIFEDNNYAGINVNSYSTVAFVDIDSDNDPDLFVGDAMGGISFWRNNGIDVPTGTQTILEESISYDIYPNPFNSVTTITYDLPSSSNVTIEIFNYLGQKVFRLMNEQQNPGHQSVQWEVSSSFPNGMYLCSLTIDNMCKTKKIILNK